MRRRLGVIAAGCLAASVVGAAPVHAAEPQDLLPDLRMARLRDIRIQTTASGQKRLRFGTIVVNVGRGPFELRGSRPNRTETLMTVQQRIFNDAGLSRYIPTPARMHYTGDGHDHWHVRRLERIEVFSLKTPDTVRRIAKRGYCFLDITRFNLTLPGAPQSKVYPESRCGDRDSLVVRPGLSVGWGDDYPWYFAFQYVDITGLPSGRYRICATADAYGYFTELNDANNSVWHDVQLDLAKNTVVQIASSRTIPCRAST